MLLRKEGAVALVVFLPQGENLLAALKAVGDGLLRLRIGVATFPVLLHTWSECLKLFHTVAIGTDKLVGRGIVECELAGDIVGLSLGKLFARPALMLVALRLVVLCTGRDAAQGHHEDSQRESDDLFHFCHRVVSFRHCCRGSAPGITRQSTEQFRQRLIDLKVDAVIAGNGGYWPWPPVAFEVDDGACIVCRP